MGDAEKSAPVDQQVIDNPPAISEGKKTPVTHAAPVKADYDVLAGELTRLGWTQQDMQLFANPMALAQAPATASAKCCRTGSAPTCRSRTRPFRNVFCSRR